jgi:phosphoserine aminotransferase
VPQPEPAARPRRPFFGSGPTAKRPGWTAHALDRALVGRSHRSGAAKARLQEALDRCRSLLDLPDDHLIGIVPASDTGAFEMAMWTMLGARGVDLVAFDSFGQGWVSDVLKQLRLEDCRVFDADYGRLPDLAAVDPARDVVFTWNGTTSGVRVPDAAWISADRAGLTLCDATSAVFAMTLDWTKLDATTFSFQKALGGEAQHGVLILSPRAVERLESHRPPWPLPKIFRLTKGGRLIDGIFKGETINTPSMLVIEDALDALRWAEEIGGQGSMIARADQNLALIEGWADQTGWVDFLASDPTTRSPTSICLTIVEPEVTAQPEGAQRALIRRMTQALERKGVAYDIAGYRDAPPGLRIWGGATVEADDVAALLPWLDWAFETARTTS